MAHFRLTDIFSLILFGYFLGTQSAAAIENSEYSVCDVAAQQSAQRFDVPLEVLLAIARTESGRKTDTGVKPWAWAINHSGQGYWFANSEQAIGYANDLLAQGVENFDVGCFQINLRWHGENFTSIENAFDPFANADYAARFLAQLFRAEGGWPQAVAAYHSRSADVGQAYLLKVDMALNELRSHGANGLAADAPPTQQQPVQVGGENRFALLQTGLRGAGASLVPIVDRDAPFLAVVP